MEDTLRLLEKIAPSAHKIGASSAIEALHHQVVSGLNETQLMRDFVADGGSLIGLVKSIVRSGLVTKPGIALQKNIPDNGVLTYI